MCIFIYTRDLYMYIIMWLTRNYVSKYRISLKIHCFICTLLPGYLPFCWVNLGSYHYSNSNSTATSSDHCSLSLYIEFLPPQSLKKKCLMNLGVHVNASCRCVFAKVALKALWLQRWIFPLIYLYIFMSLNKTSKNGVGCLQNSI